MHVVHVTFEKHENEDTITYFISKAGGSLIGQGEIDLGSDLDIDWADHMDFFIGKLYLDDTRVDTPFD